VTTVTFLEKNKKKITITTPSTLESALERIMSVTRSPTEGAMNDTRDPSSPTAAAAAFADDFLSSFLLWPGSTDATLLRSDLFF